MDKSESGDDYVHSIHCPFWPDESLEWVQRPRHFGWPTSQDISTITDFGFHLVPVGHPHSDTNLMEWRLSFSIAERTLVWSFNHIQMQCYAVMKIILKEYIKVRCNPHNQILCSYFIKTFLFWKYEATEFNFWREDNLRECIKYLMTEFSKCIREGVLRHYFIPRFNLLSVKLTRAAQIELLQLFDIIIQNDINIFKECRTLQKVWSEFLQCCENRNEIMSEFKRERFLRTEECMMESIIVLMAVIVRPEVCSVRNLICQVLAFSCKTPKQTLVLKRCLFEIQLTLLIHTCVPGNKGVYQLCRTAQNEAYSFDISTCKLWSAILLFKRRKFFSALDIINQMLSGITPFAMYLKRFIGTGAEQLYADIFLDSDDRVIERARIAWMFDLDFTKYMTDVVPLAFQIEVYFSDFASVNARLSPFTCVYYLQFLCYHRMHQYDNRDHALQQLIEVANNNEQCGRQWHSLNIAGHCLLLAGRRIQAQDIFYRSFMLTPGTHREKFNSAMWYLLNCF